jgi:hypothetical protein
MAEPNAVLQSTNTKATTSLSPQPPSPQLHPLTGFSSSPPAPLSSLATPWTLGSTNGVYALQILGLQQQQGGVVIAPSGKASDSTIHLEVSNNYSNQQQQHILLDGSIVTHLEYPLIQGQIDQNQEAGAPGVALLNQNGSNYAAAAPLAAGTPGSSNDPDALASIITNQRSLFQDRLLRQPSSCVESILAAACQVMAFDIAEVWLRTGPKTHQLTNSHLRPTALADDSDRRSELVDVYYGEKSSERTHRLSPALCKRAKEAQDVVWITASTPGGADALRCSISNVRTAVAVPICHEASNTNLTILFFSIRR